MLTSATDKITKKLEKQGLFESDEREIYLYGVQHGLFLLLNISTMAIIGVVSGAFTHVAIFLLAYMPLRSYAGGYHAKTHVKCYVASNAMVLAVAMFSVHINVSGEILVAMLIIFGIIIMALSPVGTKYKHLDKLEVDVYGRKARVICVLELLIALFFLFINVPIITTGIFWAFVMVVLLLLLEKFISGRHEAV